MQAEESVEIDHILARNIDARPHGVILFLAVRDDDVESVGCAALEDDDQAFWGCSVFDGSKRGTPEEAWYGGGTDHSESAVAEEYATGWHESLLAFSYSLLARR